MSQTAKALTDPVEGLTRIPASDVKHRGWRGVMRTLAAKGVVLVTNHNQPEAVILPADEYAQLLEKANQTDSRTNAELATLRRQFDKRLEALRTPAARDRLKSVMHHPARLHGRVKAGTSF